MYPGSLCVNAAAGCYSLCQGEMDGRTGSIHLPVRLSVCLCQSGPALRLSECQWRVHRHWTVCYQIPDPPNIHRQIRSLPSSSRPWQQRKRRGGCTSGQWCVSDSAVSSWSHKGPLSDPCPRPGFRSIFRLAVSWPSLPAPPPPPPGRSRRYLERFNFGHPKYPKRPRLLPLHSCRPLFVSDAAASNGNSSRRPRLVDRFIMHIWDET